MKASDRKFHFVVISSLFYVFFFLVMLELKNIPTALVSFIFFVPGLVNTSGYIFGGFVIGLLSQMPNSRNSRANPDSRQPSGILGCMLFIISFAILLLGVYAYNK